MCDISMKIEILLGDISTAKTDVVVNAAKPTLMGGSGVDGAIHTKVNKINGTDFLKNRIIENFGVCDDENYPRIKSGEFYVTKGYGCWKEIYHAVGIRSDEKENFFCSKGKIDKLKKLYNKLLSEFYNKGHKSIAIPIISSGSYGLDEKVARRIAYASVYNFLLKLKSNNIDSFNYIEKIIFFIKKASIVKEFRSEEKEWLKVLGNQNEMLYLNKKDSKNAYRSELKNEKVLILKCIKYILFCLEYISIIYHASNRQDVSWNHRRTRIEMLVFIQFMLVFISVVLSYIPSISLFLKEIEGWRKVILEILFIYPVFEIVMSNSKFFFFSNVINKSSNVIRSVILFTLNYITIVCSFIMIYLINSETKLDRIYLIKSTIFIESWYGINSVNTIVLIFEKVTVSYLIVIGLTILLNSFLPRKYK